jgi:hypothetical protein
MGFKTGVLRQAWATAAITGLLMSTLTVSASAEEPAKPAVAEVAPAEATTETAPAEETPELPTDIPAPATDDETPDGLRRTLVAPTTVEGADEAEDAPESDEDANIFTQWWFWAAAAAVVGGTVAVGVLASQPADNQARGCMPGYLCFGDGRE